MTLPNEFVVRGGKVVDGTGRPGFAADVVVEDGRLRVAPPESASHKWTVNVDGLVVSPGFVDTHSHADVEPFLDNERVHGARILQGITTEVVGNCGFSPFPVPPDRDEVVAPFLAAVFGPSATPFPDLDTYAQEIERRGLSSNVAPLVGHGTLRASALGYENRPATGAELAWMREALARAVDAGGFGLSTGLCYTPATYAPSSEVESLAAVVAEIGGIYSTHIRNETSLTAEALNEAVHVARATGVPLHISHLKVADPRHWHSSPSLLALLDDARSNGVDVTADLYPYTAASTSLHSLLPPWTAEEGIDRLASNLSDPVWRERVARELENGVPGWQNLGTTAGWQNVTVASSTRRPEWEGRSISDLAEPPDRHPVDTIARVLEINRGKVVVVIEAMDDSDVANFLSWPHTMVGSDGIPLPGKPHPRLTGTFPRVLGRYRERLGSMEETVRRMTGASAGRFRIPDRGVLADGMVADLVVFDEDTIADRGTYTDPWMGPVGIHYVVVGGKAAVWDSEVVDGSTGVMLRRAHRNGR
jgi:N-acyl-D-amino-acid deacylase